MKRGTRLIKSFLCLLAIVPAFWAGTAMGATVDVTPDNPDIQQAITAAGPGGTVRVADGTYFGPLKIEGQSVIIQSLNGPDNCAIVIGENQTGTVITFSGIETEGSVLSGFTISGGKGINRGGGILCDNGASPTIEDCDITGNKSNQYGGGIACLGGSSPAIIDCDIEDNSAQVLGGGLYIENSSAAIEECSISNNNALYGAGVYMRGSSDSKLLSCLIVRNSASFFGGGIYCSNASSLNITNCTLADNVVSYPASPTLPKGGGIYSNNSTPRITNCILWNDTAASGPEIYLASSDLNVSYSDVEGGMTAVGGDISKLIWDDATNIDTDPLFVGPDDYHLSAESPESPCIDSGTDLVDLPQFDFEGDPRILNGKPDMGADEARTEITVDIDIKPGSRHKEIDLRDRGVVPVAVLSSKDKDFDSRMIDRKSVLFAGAAPVGRPVLHDVNRDYLLDMLLFFRTQDLDLDQNSTEATLTGKTVEGKSFKGTDSVTIYKPKYKAKTLWKWAKTKHMFRHKHVHRHCLK